MESHGKNCCLNDPKKVRQILQHGHASPNLSSRSPQFGNGHAALHQDTHHHSHHDDLYHASHHATHHDEPNGGHSEQHHSAHQIIGVTILEFGVVLHSFVVGMTLAVVERFPTLFVVITLHRERYRHANSPEQRADLNIVVQKCSKGLAWGLGLLDSNYLNICDGCQRLQHCCSRQ